MVGQHDHFDAIVVGSGPGGATVTRELTKKSRRVLLLEWGGNAPVTGGMAQALVELGRPGRSLLLTHGLVATVRAITTGGCSIYYYGTATEPPYEMFDRHGVDLRESVRDARSELPIGPLAGDLIGPRAERIMASAVEMGLDWAPLEKFVDQDRCPRREWLDFYAAPSYESKWNARMWVDEAVAKGAILETGARVKRVLVEGTTATGVEYTTRHGTRRVGADTVVLAAGGIGTPVILRASGVRGAGRDFFFDPMIAICGEVTDGGLGDSGPEFPMATGMLLEEDGYMITDMTVPAALYGVMTAQTGRVDRLGAHGRTLQIMVKVRDALGGELTDRGGIRKRLAQEDRERFRRGFGRAKQILEGAGARNIFRSRPIASHPGATAKIGDVVDSDLQTELENLYVCDCSVVPESWGRPPTLTLIGLGKRLAHHLTAHDADTDAAPARAPIATG